MVDQTIAERFLAFMDAIFVDIHAVYDKGGNSDYPEWYCAAVDLFRPGMTYKIYFTLTDNGQISVVKLQRWWFG